MRLRCCVRGTTDRFSKAISASDGVSITRSGRPSSPPVLVPDREPCVDESDPSELLHADAGAEALAEEEEDGKDDGDDEDKRDGSGRWGDTAADAPLLLLDQDAEPCLEHGEVLLDSRCL